METRRLLFLFLVGATLAANACSYPPVMMAFGERQSTLGSQGNTAPASISSCNRFKMPEYLNYFKGILEKLAGGSLHLKLASVSDQWRLNTQSGTMIRFTKVNRTSNVMVPAPYTIEGLNPASPSNQNITQLRSQMAANIITPELYAYIREASLNIYPTLSFGDTSAWETLHVYFVIVGAPQPPLEANVEMLMPNFIFDLPTFRRSNPLLATWHPLNGHYAGLVARVEDLCVAANL